MMGTTAMTMAAVWTDMEVVVELAPKDAETALHRMEQMKQSGCAVN